MILMFIYVAYKDAPELSIPTSKRRVSITSGLTEEDDLAVEKMLLVNPDCPVRVMLEFIRKRCKFAITTHFDLCDEGGGLKGLFELPTFAYAKSMFEPKKVYYVIVMRQDKEGLTILPQVNHGNPLYSSLQSKVRRFITTGELSPSATTKATPATPAPSKRK